jgi:DNA-binding SARP family transcriptional activator/Tfp pilus assembly protein PilF
MEILVLGPLEVRAGGVPVPVRTPKVRTLLAVLALQVGHVVPLAQLVDALWGADPPTRARALIHTYVSSLRRVLAGGLAATTGSVIIRRPPGYLLSVPPELVDLTVFQQRLATGRQALAEGHFAAAAALLTAAAELWRGEVLSDINGPWAEAERARLDQLRLAALEDRFDAELALDRSTGLVDELSHLVSKNPLRERLRGQLMRALYAAGCKADALACFQQGRRVLVDELGIEPSRHLRELHQAILADDPILATPAVSRAPSRTSRFSSVPRQLPGAVRHFVGRSAEVRTLTTLLNQAANSAGTAVVCAISGTPGVGKTTLAIQVAHQVRDGFPDGQLYVNLRGFDPASAPMDPAEAIREFLDAFGVVPQTIPASIEAQAALYRSLLADKRVLVVLDNAHDTDQVRPLLPGSSTCPALVTSRNRLDGLAVHHGAHHLTLDLLPTPDARTLLGRYLGPDRMAAESESAEEIIRRCARLPLALSIAGARTAATPRFLLSTLAAELGQERARLDALDAGDSPNTDIRAVFSWSYRALPDEAARLFRLLGVHPGPDISLAAAAALAASDQHSVHVWLNQLTRAHLLNEHTPGRYQFHDLLRAYATERAAERDPECARHAALHRVLDFYLHSSFAANQHLDSYAPPIALDARAAGVIPQLITTYEEAIDWFSAEHATLLALTAHATMWGFDTHAWQLPWTLLAFQDGKVHWQEFAATQQTALAAARRLGDRSAQAHAHRGLSHAHLRLGNDTEAGIHCAQAVRLFGELGDSDGHAYSYIQVAHLLEKQGRVSDALSNNQHALDLYRMTENRTGEGVALNNACWYHVRLGDYRQALTCCQRALHLFRHIGNRVGEAVALDSLGHLHHHIGDAASAIVSYRQSLRLSDELGLTYRKAVTLTRLGNVHRATGNHAAAEAAWQRALALLDNLTPVNADAIRTQLKQLDTAVPEKAKYDFQL